MLQCANLLKFCMHSITDVRCTAALVTQLQKVVVLVDSAASMAQFADNTIGDKFC